LQSSSENVFVIQHRIATTTSSMTYMSVYNCNRHSPSHCCKTAFSFSFISARLLTAPLHKALPFASNASCDVFSALSASFFASRSIAGASISIRRRLLTSSYSSLAPCFHVCFNERCTIYLKYCYAYWLLLNNGKCWHLLPMTQLHTQDYFS